MLLVALVACGLGLFQHEVEPCPRPDYIPAWNDLTPVHKSWESRRMAAYAGLIDRVDREIGRLLQDIEAKGELDHTLVLFLSDNGAFPYDRQSVNMSGQPETEDVVRVAYSDASFNSRIQMLRKRTGLP